MRLPYIHPCPEQGGCGGSVSFGELVFYSALIVALAFMAYKIAKKFLEKND